MCGPASASTRRRWGTQLRSGQAKDSILPNSPPPPAGRDPSSRRGSAVHDEGRGQGTPAPSGAGPPGVSRAAPGWSLGRQQRASRARPPQRPRVIFGWRGPTAATSNLPRLPAQPLLPLKGTEERSWRSANCAWTGAGPRRLPPPRPAPGTAEPRACGLSARPRSTGGGLRCPLASLPGVSEPRPREPAPRRTPEGQKEKPARARIKLLAARGRGASSRGERRGPRVFPGYPTPDPGPVQRAGSGGLGGRLRSASNTAGSGGRGLQRPPSGGKQQRVRAPPSADSPPAAAAAGPGPHSPSPRLRLRLGPTPRSERLFRFRLRPPPAPPRPSRDAGAVGAGSAPRPL
ncbi:proline-rich protein 2-like [Oryctolagus cuniculus]|uniref:proline-rich protein 2-like n=1 Tax=Oryctolagus cuniculus TaxID=9986 RepID=UPI0022311A46|nr:translation initiation factor IF-2-like [Oryctolagus cuniculus]